MTARRLAWLAPLIAASAVGCFKSGDNIGSDLVDESAVHQSLHLTYQADRDTTQVFARFRVGGSGGTNLILTPPAGVTADGQPLAEQDGVLLLGTLPGKCYARTAAGFQPRAEVKYTARGGKVYTNTLTLERADHDPKGANVFSRGRSHTVAFAGPPLREGEEIVLAVTADTPKPDSHIHAATASASKAGAVAVTLQAEDLGQLPNGQAKAVWTRTATRPLQQGTPTGGELVSTYQSAELPVKLAD